jgi:hypothetical protein
MMAAAAAAADVGGMAIAGGAAAADVGGMADAKVSGDGPAEVEQRLVAAATSRQSVAQSDEDAGKKEDEKGKAARLAGLENAPVALMHVRGTTIAMVDLHGQTAPEPDWYHPARFVCSECFQPCEGVCIGWPMSSRKCPKTGVTQWIVRGQLGSVGCAMRYATDRRHSFWQETAGLLPLMLVRAYGMPEILSMEIPIGHPRTDLPPFQPELAAKWARGEITWSGPDYHRRMITPTKLPDPRKHQIVSTHTALLIDALVPRFKLGFNARQLREMFPGFFTKTPKTEQARPSADKLAQMLPAKRDRTQTVDEWFERASK